MLTKTDNPAKMEQKMKVAPNRQGQIYLCRAFNRYVPHCDTFLYHPGMTDTVNTPNSLTMTFQASTNFLSFPWFISHLNVCCPPAASGL